MLWGGGGFIKVICWLPVFGMNPPLQFGGEGRWGRQVGGGGFIKVI